MYKASEGVSAQVRFYKLLTLRVTSEPLTPDTYIIFIALQCLSVPIALLLSSPEKVQRKDGSKVDPAPKTTLVQSFKDLWRSLQRREVRPSS